MSQNETVCRPAECLEEEQLYIIVMRNKKIFLMCFVCKRIYIGQKIQVEIERKNPLVLWEITYICRKHK